MSIYMIFDFPSEIQLKILNYLPTQDIGNLLFVSYSFVQLVQELSFGFDLIFIERTIHDNTFKYFPYLPRVVLIKCIISDDAFKYISCTTIKLFRCNTISDIAIENLENINKILMYDCKYITDSAMLYLRNVHKIYIHNCNITNAGLKNVLNINKLAYYPYYSLDRCNFIHNFIHNNYRAYFKNNVPYLFNIFPSKYVNKTKRSMCDNLDIKCKHKIYTDGIKIRHVHKSYKNENNIKIFNKC